MEATENERLRNELTLDEFAATVGVSTSAVRDWLQRRHCPPLGRPLKCRTDGDARFVDADEVRALRDAKPDGAAD